jgi:predicted transcriptional regulator of viral defense system
VLTSLHFIYVLSPDFVDAQESRVVLSRAEHETREVSRQEIIRVLGVSPEAADHVIRSLRRKGWLVTPHHLRDRKILNSDVRIVNLSQRKFFAYRPVDVLGYEVNMSDVEKTAIDCADRPDLCGGIAEAAYIFAGWRRAIR